MTDKAALDKLIEAVDAGPVSLRDVHRAFPDDPQYAESASKASAGSLDAAKALHEALLHPQDSAMIGTDKPRAFVSCKNGYNFTCLAETPARAWLLAILKAYRETLP